MSAPHPAPDAALPLIERLRRDPFRVFFPLGVLAGVLGVGHWTVWTAGWPVGMIGHQHPVLQAQGFLGFFVVGFLMTALPRFTGADWARPGEIAVAAAGAAGFLAAAVAGRWAAAQAAFLLMLLTVPVFAFRRLKSATKPVPPSFALIGLGLFHAAAGSVLMAATRMGETDFALFQLGRPMAQMGFLLCVVLGVTAKLAPFLFGRAEDPRSAPPAAGAVRLADAAPHAFTGGLILATFLAEPAAPQAMRAIRAAAATLHLCRFAGIYGLPKKRTLTVLLFWLSCWLVPAGLWLAFLFPAHAAAMSHVTFIGGFSLMIFSFGLLVVLSHTGRAVLLNGPLWPLRIAGPLVLIALALRIAADFAARRIELLHSASGLWVLAAVIWLAYALRNMSAGSLSAEPVRVQRR